MKLIIINGPNLNMLGIREPDIYGRESYDRLCERIREYCSARSICVDFYQSNHEGDLIDKIQQAYGVYDGIIINPSAYTHTSIGLPDAIKAVKIPAIEVHISDPDKREPYRKTSFVRSACLTVIKGLGTDSYLRAIDYLADYLK